MQSLSGDIIVEDAGLSRGRACALAVENTTQCWGFGNSWGLAVDSNVTKLFETSIEYRVPPLTLSTLAIC